MLKNCCGAKDSDEGRDGRFDGKCEDGGGALEKKKERNRVERRAEWSRECRGRPAVIRVTRRRQASAISLTLSFSSSCSLVPARSLSLSPFVRTDFERASSQPELSHLSQTRLCPGDEVITKTAETVSNELGIAGLQTVFLCVGGRRDRVRPFLRTAFDRKKRRGGKPWIRRLW
jgi:hypothetical protein